MEVENRPSPRDNVIRRAVDYIELLHEARIQHYDGDDDIATETENRAELSLDLLEKAVEEYLISD